MSTSEVAEPMRIGKRNLRPSPTERPQLGVAGRIQRGFLVTPTLPAFGFGWCLDGEPSIQREQLMPSEALAEFRHAWRRCNGGQWRWRMTFRGQDIDGCPDDLLEALDELSVTQCGFVIGVRG